MEGNRLKDKNVSKNVFKKKKKVQNKKDTFYPDV